jgi:hypothetical protein
MESTTILLLQFNKLFKIKVMEVKDYLGNPIHEGDKVLYIKDMVDDYSNSGRAKRIVTGFKQDKYHSFVGITKPDDKTKKVGYTHSFRVINLRYIHFSGKLIPTT